MTKGFCKAKGDRTATHSGTPGVLNSRISENSIASATTRTAVKCLKLLPGKLEIQSSKLTQIQLSWLKGLQVFA